MNTTCLSDSIQTLLFDFSYCDNCFFTPLPKKEKEFGPYWEALLGLVPGCIKEPASNRTGRKAYALMDILVVWTVKEFFNLKTVSAALDFISLNGNLRTMTSMENIPSHAVVSRRTRELNDKMDTEEIHSSLCASFYADRIVGNLSMDSIIIEAREKPIAGTKERHACKRGRKEKGSREAKELEKKRKRESNLKNRERKGNINTYIKTLNAECSKTAKKNSRGDMQWKVGYKIHLAVDDFGIPLASVITGANVHDSKAAIPLLRISKQRCNFLYALMDGGYSSKEIEDFTVSLDAVPVIDFKADRNGNKREEDPAKAERYKARTTVERTNREMKACFIPHALYSRGERAIFEMRLAVLLTAIKKMGKVISELKDLQTA